MSIPMRVAIFELLNTKNFRSDFRKGLRDQFLQWIAVPFEGGKRYPSPFSQEQQKYLLTHLVLDKAKKIEDTFKPRHKYLRN